MVEASHTGLPVAAEATGICLLVHAVTTSWDGDAWWERAFPLQEQPAKIPASELHLELLTGDVLGIFTPWQRLAEINVIPSWTVLPDFAFTILTKKFFVFL